MEIRLNDVTALLAGPLDDVMMATAQALRSAGAALVFDDNLARRPQDGERLLPQHDGSPDQLIDALSTSHRLNVLIVNAAYHQICPFLDLSEADWDLALNGNFVRPVLLAQAFARQFVAQPRDFGRMLFVTGFESVMPFEGAAAAGATLTMLWSMARMIAVDMAPYSVTANVIAPGWTEGGAAFNTHPDRVKQHILNGIPLARAARAEEIAALITFLASPLSGYITGQMIPIDGGYTLTKSPGRSMFEP